MIQQDTALRRKPALPRELYKASGAELVGFVFCSLSLWIGPGLAAAWVARTGLSFGIKGLAVVLLGYISAHGLVFAVSLGHEASHGSLPVARKTGMVLALFLSSALPGYMNMGFSLLHLQHHKYTNTPADPDVHYYAKYKTLFGRLFLTRVMKNALYMKAAYDGYRGRAKLAGYSAKDVQRLAVLNFGFVVGWLVAYVALAVASPLLFATLVAVPTACFIVSSGPLTYQQHAGTGDTPPEDYWRNTRSLTSPVWTAMYGGFNFHLEHHLYPGVVVWRLARVHRYLKANGYLDQAGMHVDGSGLSAYGYASSKYAYPDPTGAASTGRTSRPSGPIRQHGSEGTTIAEA